MSSLLPRSPDALIVRLFLALCPCVPVVVSMSLVLHDRALCSSHGTTLIGSTSPPLAPFTNHIYVVLDSGSCLSFSFQFDVCPFFSVCQVLEFNHIDCPLAIGYMLALPTRQAYDAFRRTIRYSSDDYGRYIFGRVLRRG